MKTGNNMEYQQTIETAGKYVELAYESYITGEFSCAESFLDKASMHLESCYITASNEYNNCIQSVMLLKHLLANRADHYKTER